MKSSGGVAAAAAALAVLFIAGGSAAAIHVVSSGFGSEPAPTTQPVRADIPATATMPASPGTGSGTATSPTGTPGPSSTKPSGTATPSGAVPGASPAITALTTARAADEALPHSPQLLQELAGQAAAASGSAVSQATSLTTVRGIDVASYQHPNGAAINWTSVAGAGYKFVAVKTTEGDYYINPYAIPDIVAAMRAGMFATAYHFAIPNITSGAYQAQFAVQGARYLTSSRALPLMLDIEYDPYVSTDGTNECYGLSQSAMRSWISSFVSEAHSLTKQYPIIYTTADWWDTCTGSSTAFGNDPMWVAAYGVSSPPMPAGWRSYTYWQYTSGGTVPGVDTPDGTDLSYFNGGVVGMIQPGTQRSNGGATIGMQVNSLDALARATLTFTASGLPPGLAITTAGDIRGTITKGTAGVVKNYPVTVTARNGSGASQSVTFTWQVTG